MVSALAEIIFLCSSVKLHRCHAAKALLRRDLSRWFPAKITYYSKAAIVQGYSTRATAAFCYFT